MSRAAAVRGLVATGAALSLTFANAPPAAAHLHFMKIREIFGGTEASPGAQYVELQMYLSGQNFVDGAHVHFYDASGTLQVTATFSSDVARGQDNSTILIATQQAEDLFGVQADLELGTAALAAAGGKVCFEGAPFGVVDCASFGDFTGDPAGTGTPFNGPEGIPAGAAMLREVSGGSDPNELDAGDDTNQSANDFRFAAPSPENNAGTSGSSPGAVLNFSVRDFAVAEAGSSATISVVRSGGGGATTDVDYFTVEGSATADVDYTPAAGTLSFSGVDTTQTFSIPVADDGDDESDETVLLRLRNASSDTVFGPRPNATLTIVDDEGAPPDETAPVSRITRPDHRSSYRAGRLTSLRGTAQDASGIAEVEIALRMTRTNGLCRWFNGTRFVERACGDKRWKAATGTDAWRYALPRPLPRSKGTKVRHYTLFSRAADTPGNVEGVFEKARNANRFEIR